MYRHWTALRWNPASANPPPPIEYKRHLTAAVPVRRFVLSIADVSGARKLGWFGTDQSQVRLIGALEAAVGGPSLNAVFDQAESWKRVMCEHWETSPNQRAAPGADNLPAKIAD